MVGVIAVFSENKLPAKRLSVSLGLAVYPDEAASLEELIQNADNQLYRAKREGKNRVCFYPEKATPNLKAIP